VNERLIAAASTAQIWVFDVDATLVDGMSATSLRPGATELLALLQAKQRRIVVWSAGGEEYARRRLSAVGVIGYVDAVHGKGDRTEEQCYDPCRVVLESELGVAVFVDDQPSDLSARSQVLPVRPYLAANPHDTELILLRARLTID
jgi:long-chain acyl-CoA synthetase